jgi:hypothetical protein
LHFPKGQHYQCGKVAEVVRNSSTHAVDDQGCQSTGYFCSKQGLINVKKEDSSRAEARSEWQETKDFAARVHSCPDTNPTISAASVAARLWIWMHAASAAEVGNKSAAHHSVTLTN